MKEYKSMDKLNLYLACKDLLDCLNDPGRENLLCIAMAEALAEEHLKNSSAMNVPPRMIADCQHAIKILKNNPSDRKGMVTIVKDIQMLVHESLDNVEFVNFSSSDVYYQYLSNPEEHSDLLLESSPERKKSILDRFLKSKSGSKSNVESLDIKSKEMDRSLSPDDLEGEIISEDELLATDAVENVQAEFDAILRDTGHQGQLEEIDFDEIDTATISTSTNRVASESSSRATRKDSVSSSSSVANLGKAPESKDEDGFSKQIKKEIEQLKSRIDIIVQQLTLCDIMEHQRKFDALGKRWIKMNEENLQKELKSLQFQKEQLEMELQQGLFQPVRNDFCLGLIEADL